MKTFKIRIALILGALLAIFYFSSDFALIDIEKTAIVVAIGIDEGENSRYKITAQIAIPQATDTAAANDDAVVTADGNTVMEGIQNIGAKTGWHPKLSFCSLVLIGRKVAENGVKDVIDYFIVSEKVQNSAIVAMADDKAGEILTSKTPLDAISSFAVSKIVLKSRWMTNTVPNANLRKIALSEYSPSKSSFMPVIKPIKENTKSKEGGSSSITASTKSGGSEGSGGGGSGGGESGGGGGGGGESSGGSSGGKDVPDKVYDASTLAVFSEFKLKGEFDEELTQIFNMLMGPLGESYITLENGDEKTLLSLSNGTRSVKVNLEKKPTIEIKLSFKVEVSDSSEGYSLDKLNRRSVVDEDTITKVTDKLNVLLLKLVDKVKESGADALLIRDKIYKFSNSRFEEFKNYPLDYYDYLTTGEVKSLD